MVLMNVYKSKQNNMIKQHSLQVNTCFHVFDTKEIQQKNNFFIIKIN